MKRHFDKVLEALRDPAVCAQCKRLLIQDVNCFFGSLCALEAADFEVQQLPPFQSCFPEPALRACKACGRRALQNFSCVEPNSLSLASLTDFMRGLMGVEYRQLLATKEVYYVLQYCYCVCGAVLQKKALKSEDAATQTQAASGDGVYKQALKRIARSMNMKYAVPELVVRRVEEQSKPLDVTSAPEALKAENLGLSSAATPPADSRKLREYAASLSDSGFRGFAAQFLAAERARPQETAKGAPAQKKPSKTAQERNFRGHIIELHQALAAARGAVAALKAPQGRALRAEQYTSHLDFLLDSEQISGRQMAALFKHMAKIVRGRGFVESFFAGCGTLAFPRLREALLPSSEAYIVELLAGFEVDLQLAPTPTRFQFDFSESEKLRLCLAVAAVFGCEFDARACAFGPPQGGQPARPLITEFAELSTKAQEPHEDFD